MQLDAHVDGSGQNKEVARVDYVRASGGPDKRQVEIFKCELASVSWEGTGDCEIEKQSTPFSLLPNCRAAGSG